MRGSTVQLNTLFCVGFALCVTSPSEAPTPSPEIWPHLYFLCPNFTRDDVHVVSRVLVFFSPSSLHFVPLCVVCAYWKANGRERTQSYLYFLCHSYTRDGGYVFFVFCSFLFTHLFYCSFLYQSCVLLEREHG